MTQEHRYLNKFGTIASFFALLIGLIRVRYIWPQPIGTFHDIWTYANEFSEKPVFTLVIFILCILSVYLLAFLTHNLCEGAIIASIAKIEDQKQRLSFSKSFSLGLYSFLRLTEYNAATSLFDIGSLVVYTLLIRYIVKEFIPDYDFIADFYPIIIFVGIFVSIISLLLTYGKYVLVIHKKGIVKSVDQSLTLVMFHLGETLLITILVVLITLRAIINIVLVFLIPGMIAWAASYLLLKFSLGVVIAIVATIGIIIFWFVARLAGVLMVFIHAVWTLTFLEIDKQKEHKILSTEKEEED